MNYSWNLRVAIALVAAILACRCADQGSQSGSESPSRDVLPEDTSGDVRRDSNVTRDADFPPGSRCSVSGEQGRCAVGREVGTDGGTTCQAALRALPEICNGLDDDCDGKVDNIKESWERGNPETGEAWDVKSNDSEAQTLTCNMSTSCRCGPEDADARHRGVGDSTRAEFDRMLERTQSDCDCAE
ncbi:MAG: hypothetical protein ABEL76_10310 [Bradymonadaceae bacterium]